MEHHSNLVPWQKVTKATGAKLSYMYINDNFELTDEEIEEKITDKTKIVGIAHVSNVLGTINNVKKIIKYAHSKCAILIVDASQSIPHMKIDVQDLNCDFLVFSGHKMLAPLGIGVLYGKKELLNKMNPFLMGGDMIEYVYEQETTYAPLPNKFEAGTQNVEGVIGLGAAIDYIENLGYDNIQKLENEVVSYARAELSKLDYLTLYLTSNEENHSGVISFNVKGVHPHDVASILDTEGVCVRSGNHCAQPLMRYLGIDSTCRASFYFYNTKEDVDKLVQALNKAYEMFKKYIH
jgi:cysteine desulfurase/selenocysteine lyase